VANVKKGKVFSILIGGPNTITKDVPNPPNIPLKFHSNWANSTRVDYWKFLVEVLLK
jgi:hypothetical protein